MSNDEIVALIEQRQRELAGMRDFQADYLERRRARGTRTSTDVVMEGHQRTIGETLDLLEAIKAEKASEAGVLSQMILLNEREIAGASCAEVIERVKEIEALDPRFRVECWRKERNQQGTWVLITQE